ncbi:MAG: hypothetical protein LKH59_03475 [Lactobacillus crispatus]|jgi:hypothetical protein|nr:hypothetical protein [Lactobacillus crispatus]MCI1335270.1 hypothetical protein [Lactobacillus crispatus]MCI1364930.1 hypothetical protein [Lactobacillus crispatus]MCI1493557.1 hypothetical protein [Lactobacillus crispatus]MCI1537931.1 hypothetical protein [Lactobacillus crispatus]
MKDKVLIYRLICVIALILFFTLTCLIKPTDMYGHLMVFILSVGALIVEIRAVIQAVKLRKTTQKKITKKNS